MAQPKNGVSAQDVKKIARLSRLHVEEDRLQPIAEDLNGILGWIEQLGEVDVEGVEPMTSAVDMAAPLRAAAQPYRRQKSCLLYTSPSPRDS